MARQDGPTLRDGTWQYEGEEAMVPARDVPPPAADSDPVFLTVPIRGSVAEAVR